MATVQKKVPFFNYPFVFTELEDDFVSVLQDVGRRGAFILQKDIEEFEKSLREYTGAKYALGVANGTDALILAVRSAGVGSGDEVIFCTHTFIATAAAIHFSGATPVPVDCGPDHLMDPEVIEAAITPRTKAIMPTQLNGRTCNMDRIMSIAQKHGLMVIEDAAQALGSRFKGKAAGTFGLAGTISFFPAKNLGALGDAGAILTNDENMYEKLYAMRDHGRNKKGDLVLWGFNSRLDNLQAAFLNRRMRDYDKIVQRRREIATLYREFLGNVRQLVLPPAPGSRADHFDVYQNYEIEAEHRDELKSFLSEHGVGVLIQWGGQVVHQFKSLGFNVFLPYTERLLAKMLLLPMNNSLSDEDVRYVCSTVREFYRERNLSS